MALRSLFLALVLASAPAFAQGADVVPPEPLEMPEIPCPEGATSTTPVVDVEVQLVVSATGEVTKAEVVHGAGEPFDSAVVEGVKKFRFKPATIGGVPSDVVVPFTHHFVVAPRPVENEAVPSGPVRDAVLLGIVQERGTKATPSGLAVVAKSGENEFATTTDDQGHFRLEIPSGDLEVRVVDSRHRPFLQHEKLAAKEELKVRYLIDRQSYNPYEAVVVATRERTEVSRTTLSGREITKIPGTFGDPFRVVTVLPGVTTVMSLLPYPIVRGSSPGNTGILLDGVRVPLLFHLFAGPAIIHPEFIDRVDFYPGGFPVNYGNYTGGIVDGITRRPSTDPQSEVDVSLTSAGVFLRRTYDPLGITATVAGRYGYPGLILSQVAPTINLSYWDYQARLDGSALGGHWTVFAYGAKDDLETGTINDDGSVTFTPLTILQTHHLDLRFRRGSEDHEQSARVVLLDDSSQTGSASLTKTLGIQPQLRWHEKLSDALSFDVGLDGSFRAVTTTRDETSRALLQNLSGLLQDSGNVLSGGAFAQIAWKPIDRLLLIPGVRADIAHDDSATKKGVDPRLLARFRIAGDHWLKGVIGIYHQPPRLSLPIPGADEAKLSYDLLASKQASVGAELKLSRAVELDVQTYYNANSPVLFDLSVNQDLSQVQNAPPTVEPGEKPPPSTRVNRAAQTIDRLATPIDGRAYGLEILLRKRDSQGFFGWVAYTLSRSERQKDGVWVPFDFDRTHILNAVAGVRLPRNWEFGARVLFQSGTPVTNIHGYNAGRTDPQFRFDVRVDKRAVWNEWLLDFYVDVIDSTVAAESGGLVGSSAVRYVLPTVGFRAVL